MSRASCCRDPTVAQHGRAITSWFVGKRCWQPLGRREKMSRILLGLLVVGSAVLLSNFSSVIAQEPDATVKITRRSVAEGIGLSWGEGVLSYKGNSYSFTFRARAPLRELDASVSAAELSGEVFNLKKVDDFNGNYQIVDGKEMATGGGTRATLQNQNGVRVNLFSTVEGRKFTLGRDGMDIEIKKQKP
jgi:hypothetical protein